MSLNHVTLDDKYDLSKSRIFATGYQALIRLCLMQKERDRRAGLNTAGFVTGYRGSPLGGLDQQFIRAARQLAPNDIRFHPGLNEDLAATSIWGSQQAELRGEGKYDGVFAMWYGKGPGVDRTGDVFRHANFAGTSKHGGVLALMGDDHTAEILHHRASIGIPLPRRDDPDPEPGGRPGIPRLRALRLGDVALLRHLGRAQVHARDGGVDRRHRRQPRSREDRHSGKSLRPRRRPVLPHARRRPQHPARRQRARHGGAPARLQARRDARVRARQQSQPLHHLGRPQSEDRHHHRRQELSRRAPGARRAWHRGGSTATTSASGSTRSRARGR